MFMTRMVCRTIVLLVLLESDPCSTRYEGFEKVRKKRTNRVTRRTLYTKLGLVSANVTYNPALDIKFLSSETVPTIESVGGFAIAGGFEACMHYQPRCACGGHAQSRTFSRRRRV